MLIALILPPRSAVAHVATQGGRLWPFQTAAFSTFRENPEIASSGISAFNRGNT
jgi:hypothetical protein